MFSKRQLDIHVESSRVVSELEAQSDYCDMLVALEPLNHISESSKTRKKL
jgi:hypothetical protein